MIDKRVKIIYVLAFILLDTAVAKYLQWPDSNTKCGCSMRVSTDGYANADCSNRPELDLECLAALGPSTLNLSGNGLEDVPPSLLGTGFENATQLDLSYNVIKRLSSWSFGSMPGLKSLNLSGNQLTDLPRSVARIELVDVSNNQLTDIHSIIGLVNIKAIVKGNQIRCSCDSPTVKRIYETERNVTLECIYDDSTVPRPLPYQCQHQIHESETISNTWDYILPFLLALAVLAIAARVILCRCYGGFSCEWHWGRFYFNLKIEFKDQVGCSVYTSLTTPNFVNSLSVASNNSFEQV